MPCLAVALLCLLPVDGPDELAKHQGTWAVVSQVRDGQDAPANVVASIRRVVEGDHVTWIREGKNFAGTKVVYDVTKSPHALDLIPDGGPHRGEHVLGIYKLEGDTLTICVADPGEPRPSAFEAAAGSKRTLQTFKRIKALEQGKAKDRKVVDRARLQGTWIPTSAVDDGEPTEPRSLALFKMLVGGRSKDLVERRGPPRIGSGTHRARPDPITPGDRPDPGDGPSKGSPIHGDLSASKGDQLTFASL